VEETILLSHGSEEATAALAKAIMLNQYEAVSYLLQHKLLSPAHVVAGDVKVVDVSRRHHNYKVTTAEGPGYVMKQGVGQDRVAAIEREAAVYQFLVSGTKELSHYLPRFCAYDAEECALILELVDGAENLREYHLHRGYFPVSVARVLGNALGTLHRLTEARKNEEEHRIRGQPPWVFSVHRPVIKFLQECSSANLQLIQIVQQFPVFCNLLDALREEWRIEVLIHGDIRWDNCIVFGKSSSARKCRLKIVDWELASMGDPCWDVASVFNDYLSFWLLSIPVTGEMPPDRFLWETSYWRPQTRTKLDTRGDQSTFPISLTSPDSRMVRLASGMRCLSCFKPPVIQVTVTRLNKLSRMSVSGSIRRQVTGRICARNQAEEGTFSRNRLLPPHGAMVHQELPWPGSALTNSTKMIHTKRKH
jgi:Ser/Thr protein kinase RdoA (MazF antagonist)